MNTLEFAENVLKLCIDNGITVNQLKEATDKIIETFHETAVIDPKKE